MTYSHSIFHFSYIFIIVQGLAPHLYEKIQNGG
jgi:hypothetical protein